MVGGKGRRGGSYGDANRDGVDDDVDQAPGNSSDSAEYAKRYDYGSTTEYTPYGMDRTEQIRARQIESENREYEASQQRKNDRDAQSRVHFWPDVGKFIVPEENTWVAHAQIVKDDSNKLTFNPEKYMYFDKIIAQKAGIPALYDIGHPDYDKYEGLRTNLEVLRNDIIGYYLDDGSYDPGDEIFVPQIKAIASALGEALENDKWYNRFGGVYSLNVDIANIEGVGAAAMYEHLLALQKKPAPMQALRDRLNKFFGVKQDAIWELPPIEETPFSAENLAAPPPKPADPPPADERSQEESNDPYQEIVNVADKAIVELPKMSVDEMEAMAKEESIEEARKILRNLRNMEFGDHDIAEWIDTGTPKAQAAKANAINKLVQIQTLHTQLAQAHNPDVADDMFVQDGKNAAAALRLGVAEYALRNLPKDHPKVPDLERLVFQSPEQAHVRQGQAVERLLDNLSTGLERATGRQIYDRSPSERLISASNRIQKTARRMKSIETLDPPARQESLDLAHDILRRLRDMEMSRQPLSQFIETSRPEEKAAVAEKIDEVVDMYRNLVSEAVHINPELMQDERIQEGIEAVQEFAHTVKLMASKEVPNSVASAQQIGADVTQDPEEWDKLHDRTIERILTSMEGGLEEAVDTIEVQEQQEEEQAEEQERESAASALNQFSNSRKKKRRWSYSRSGAGGKRQDKISQDIRADDRATGQGRFSEDSPQAGSGTGMSASVARAATSKGNSGKQQNNDKAALNAQMADTVRDSIRSEEMNGNKPRRDTAVEATDNSAKRSNTSASRNSRTNRNSRRNAEANRSSEEAAREIRASERATRNAERDARNTAREQRATDRAAAQQQSGSRNSPMGGSSSGGNSSRSNPNTPPETGASVPKGLNPEALAALQQAIKQDGNTLLNMNKQVSNIPKGGVSNNQTDRANADRDQQNRNNNNNRPQGSGRN